MHRRISVEDAPADSATLGSNISPRRVISRKWPATPAARIAGDVHFLSKPFTLKQLAAKVKEVMASPAAP